MLRNYLSYHYNCFLRLSLTDFAYGTSLNFYLLIFLEPYLVKSFSSKMSQSKYFFCAHFPLFST